jgi:pimeloyl-ACP methyl ester carboxylesterase
LFGVIYDDLARAAGVRWISVDKPGYGHSTIDPHRSLARYVEDIRQLMDHLALDRAAMYGESGGGPHLLALAHGLPERITTAIVVSGLGPGHEPWVRRGMTPANRFMFWSARHAPWLTRANMALMGRGVCAPQRRATLEKFMTRQAPPVDRAVMQRHPELLDAIHDSGVDAFRQGSRGAAQEFEMFARPWHFTLEEIRVPLQLWHGTADRNVPIDTALEIARRVPNCVTHILEDAGHLMIMDHRDAILAAVLQAAD